MSHPSWVRGLKLFGLIMVSCFQRSHPSWVRGLKRNMFGGVFSASKVAPLVGAWIETD